jgi:hypothetical protein
MTRPRVRDDRVQRVPMSPADRYAVKHGLMPEPHYDRGACVVCGVHRNATYGTAALCGPCYRWEHGLIDA